MWRFHRDYLFFSTFLYVAMGLLLVGSFGWLAYQGYRENHTLPRDESSCFGCPQAHDVPLFDYENLAGAVGFMMGGVWAGWLWRKVKKADLGKWRATRGLVVAEVLLVPGLVVSTLVFVGMVVSGIALWFNPLK